MPHHTRDSYLDADEIRAATFVRHVEIHDTLGSTNDRAADLARDTDIELPALVAARQQIAGRGRRNSTWLSAEGALTFSILLEPATLGIGTANWPQLSLVTAIAICDALSNELNPKSEIRNPKYPRLAIKWPNDILLDGAKLCGILIESPGGLAPAKYRLIIGIGINVNNSWPNTMRDDSVNGSALCDITGQQHDLNMIIVRVICALNDRIRQLAKGDSQLFDFVEQICASPTNPTEYSNPTTEIKGTETRDNS